MKWTREMVRSNTTSEYWVQVGNTLAQFDGMVEGYAKYCAGTPTYTPLSATEMMFMRVRPPHTTHHHGHHFFFLLFFLFFRKAAR
jgi:hypothetical protein